MMHTHYDNLKISRTAPQEVIRAAYRALAQKFHPDRNAGDAEAERVIRVLNQSYEVLRDPIKRVAHDAWIAQQESMTAVPPAVATPSVQRPPPPPPAPAPRPYQASRVPRPALPAQRPLILRIVAHVFNYWFIYLALGIWIWWANTDHSLPATPSIAPKLASSPPPKARYVRPVQAPNGYSFPRTDGYVDGYPLLFSGGMSSLTVDNSQNDSDVFVKLVNLDVAAPTPVRHFFIRAGSQFRASEVVAGNFDVRYRDLNSGALSRSDAFVLTETTTYEGTRYSDMTMTLYKVRNGNMKTHGLDESEF
ncbi:MAG: J domain-containing protein [Aeromicrobium sp.]|nr:J domain-containing protein [Burkholderiales bacterium]